MQILFYGCKASLKEMGIQSQRKNRAGFGRAAHKVTQCGHDVCDPAGIAERQNPGKKEIVIAILIDRRQTREN